MSKNTENISKNWLVTGGCGFLGTSLIHYLKQQGGHNIRVLDNLSIGSRGDLAHVTEFSETLVEDIEEAFSGTELIVGDILDVELSEKVTKGIDVIVHFAANTGVGPSVEDPRMDCQANVVGTFNYLEAARINNVTKFVFASSGAPAGEVEPPIHEELPPHPVSPYGASKLAGEGYCSAYFRTFAIDAVMLRFGNVYGPGSKHKSSVVAKFIRQALNSETCEIYGDGTQTRDFIYIDDLIDAVNKAATIQGIGGEAFQIASSRECTINEVSALIKHQLSRDVDIEMVIKQSEPRVGDVMRNFSDISKAKKLLSWEPKIALDEGITKTLSYFLR